MSDLGRASVTRCEFNAEGVRFLVTGAAGLVGRALVERFASAGATVIAVDRTEQLLDAVAADWPAHVGTLAVDLSDAESVERLRDHPYLTDIDVLVNNAAVTHLRSSLLDTSAAELDLIHAVNVRAVTLLSGLVVSKWRESDTSGCIINLSSPGATRAHENQAAYDGSKGAIEALTRAMAVEWGAYGVRVNALAPAQVQDHRLAVGDAPLGWASTGRDVADAALWLVSDAATIVTGQVIALDGGLLARLRTPDSANPQANLFLVDAKEGTR